MIIEHIVTHSLFYGFTANLYLFLMMVLSSPRVWGYADYPDHIKSKVPPQTKRERTLAAVFGVPWMIYVLGFPFFRVIC